VVDWAQFERELQEEIDEIRALPPSERQNIKAPPGLLSKPAGRRKSLSANGPDLFSALAEDDSSGDKD
jgi:hypothetical protein